MGLDAFHNGHSFGRGRPGGPRAGFFLDNHGHFPYCRCVRESRAAFIAVNRSARVRVSTHPEEAFERLDIKSPDKAPAA